MQFSLFPRINPRYDECEPEEAIVAFKPVPTPKVLEMFGTAELECAKDFQADYSQEPYTPDFLIKDLGAISQVHAKVLKLIRFALTCEKIFLSEAFLVLCYE